MRSKINTAKIAKCKLQARKDLINCVGMLPFMEVLEFLRLSAAVIAGCKLANLQFSITNRTMRFLHSRLVFPNLRTSA